MPRYRKEGIVDVVPVRAKGDTVGPPDIRGYVLVEDWQEKHAGSLGAKRNYDGLRVDMERECRKHVMGITNSKYVTRRQQRQCEIVSMHTARAAMCVLEAKARSDIGVSVDGKEDRICLAQQGRFKVGGCRQVWRAQIRACRFALAWTMAVVNGDGERKQAFYKSLWMECLKIVELECVNHCWEGMKTPAKRIYDQPPAPPRQLVVLSEATIGRAVAKQLKRPCQRRQLMLRSEATIPHVATRQAKRVSGTSRRQRALSKAPVSRARSNSVDSYRLEEPAARPSSPFRLETPPWMEEALKSPGPQF